jgi:hypothetical protein
MMSERDLVKAIFKTALTGTGGDTNARKEALWTAAITLLSDVLLSTDPFNRERLLRGLVSELRASTDHLSQCISEERGKLN